MYRKAKNAARLLSFCILSATGIGISAQASDAEKNIIPNSDFEKVNGDWFSLWERGKGQSVGEENGNHFMTLEGNFYRRQLQVPLKPNWKALKISHKMRTVDVVKGRKSFQDARLVLQFTNSEGKMVGKWPKVFGVEGTTDWKQYSHTYTIPKGAGFLKVGPAMFGASGRMDFDDFSIIPVIDPNYKAPVKVVAKKLPMGTNLIKNADLSIDSNGNGKADNWTYYVKAKSGQDGDKKSIVIDGSGKIFQVIGLNPDYQEIKVSHRMRLKNVVAGAKSWHKAKLGLEFRDDNNKRVGKWPKTFSGVGTTEWKDYSHNYIIPAGATKLYLAPSNGGKSGIAEFSSLSVVVSKEKAPKVDVAVPKGVDLDPNLENAWKQESSTRAKICMNGLWQFLPVVDGEAGALPGNNQGWGWFKVPGVWKAKKAHGQKMILSDYIKQSGSLDKLSQAWYKRSIKIPATWTNRQVELEFEMVQTHAKVFVDGKEAGSQFFPGGKVDITKYAKPGKVQEIAILLTARPLTKSSEVIMAAGRTFKMKATVGLRGITGDLYLTSRKSKELMQDIRINTSTRKNEIEIVSEVANSTGGKRTIKAEVYDKDQLVKTFTSELFDPATLKENRVSFKSAWEDPKLWDTHTPENKYNVVLTLADESGNVIDQKLPEQFGFREFWIDGKDFYLNGKRIHLRAVTTSNVNGGSDMSNYNSSVKTCQRMKKYGFNFLITHNYHFKAGSVSYFRGLFDAADDQGIVTSVSLPHASEFKWRMEDPEVQEEYRKISRFLVRFAQNHPSVMMYTSCHNAAGYKGDQNPQHMSGKFNPDDPKYGGGKNKIRTQALITAKIAKELDPTKPVYHHSSGNLGDMHTNNIYLNWAPIEERSDWLENWSKTGTKPVFFVEWGLPHVASFANYRGPSFIWRKRTNMFLWANEFSSAYLGERAYEYTPQRVKSLRHEEKVSKDRKDVHYSILIWHFRYFEKNAIEIQTLFNEENWRAHRTWGLSAGLPWDQDGMWKSDSGRVTENNPDKYKNLGQPGIVPDTFYPSSKFDKYLYAHDDKSYYPTSLGKSYLRWNMPVIGYIGGGPDRFTEKGHNFKNGETIQKQLVIVNDERIDKTVSYTCTFNGKTIDGSTTVKPGDVAYIPVKFNVDAAAGEYKIDAVFNIDSGKQTDSFTINVVDSPEVNISSNVALFDPKGLTAPLLDSLGIKYEKVQRNSDVSKFEIFIVGREALNNTEPMPDFSNTTKGQRVIIMEQQSDVLSNRLGFRVNEIGVRNVFIRDKANPAFDGLSNDTLKSWQGASTLLSPYVSDGKIADPVWNWCGFQNTRVWRCGNYGNVASVIIEKPNRGNFTPLIDCAFDLQYTPLMEFTNGAGAIIFSQLDLSGRTKADPAGEKLFAGLLKYVDTYKPRTTRNVMFKGDSVSEKLLSNLGIKAESNDLDNNALLVIGPKAEKIEGLNSKVEAGLNILCLGLNAKELENQFGSEFKASKKKLTSQLIKDASAPALKGVSNADLHMRTELTFAALKDTDDASTPALKVVKKGKGTIVLCQVAPWMFDYDKDPYLRTTFRRNVHLVSKLLQNLGADSQSELTTLLSEPEYRTSNFVLPSEWVGKVDKDGVGRDAKWNAPSFDDSSWMKMIVPGSFDKQIPELADYEGKFWYRLDFDSPKSMTKGDKYLDLGGVDDESWIWLNGKFLGEISKKTNPDNYWRAPRRYKITDDMLNKDGKNTLVVLVNDIFMYGGINGTPRITSPGPWNNYYIQKVEKGDDPYRYYRW